MSLELDISSLHPLARKIVGPGASEKLKKKAATGVVPGSPDVIVSVVVALSLDDDPEISQQATQAARKLDINVIRAAFQKSLPAAIIDRVARLFSSNDEVLGLILDHADVDPETVAFIAEHGSELICERVATNEQRLLEYPDIIKALYFNEHTRSSTADRAVELAIRNDITVDIPAFENIKAAMANELIAEPSEEPTPDDLLFKQVSEMSKEVDVDPEVEDTHVTDDEGHETVDEKCAPLWVQLSNMTPAQKIRRALLGTSTERLLLVRDSNRLVAESAIRSPKVRENEVVKISSSRSVSDEVLRIISKNREWVRNHQVKYNLVTNPRTPFARVLPLLHHLRDHELRAVAKSKNVPSNVSAAARQQLAKRKKS